MDQDSSDVPEPGEALVSASSSGLAIKVHHAADTDLAGYRDDDVIPLAQVEVDVHVGPDAPPDVLYRGSIDVSSGVLTVGDADHDDRLEVGAGHWHIQIDCTPPDEHADKVVMWLQRSRP